MKDVALGIIRMEQLNVCKLLLALMWQMLEQVHIHLVKLENFKMKKVKQAVRHVQLGLIKMKQGKQVVKHVK